MSSTGRGSGINMTPLIDVVLVLLVIVLITAQVASRTKRTMAATLPKAAGGQQDVSSPHVVSAMTDGRLFYDKQPIELANLPAVLTASDAAHGRVVLDVEAQVPHQRVIELLDALAGAGVTDAAFATEKRK